MDRLRKSLLELLGTDQVEWYALSRALKTLASENSETIPSAQEDRRIWLLLADYLADADPTRGVPTEIRQLLDSDEAARAAHAAFTEAMSQRQEWLAFAKQLARNRNPELG